MLTDPLPTKNPALPLIDQVVNELVTGQAEIPASSLMVIGARARDYWHAYFERTDLITATSDADIAIAVKSHADYSALTKPLPRSGDTYLRFLVADLPTDLLPFGGIENPAGSVERPGKPRDHVDVFGMAEVFHAALDLPLPSGITIKIPSPAGYAALKMKAWIDRSTRHEHKDASDLALACSWYAEHQYVLDWIFKEESPQEKLLTLNDGDTNLVAAEILGHHAANALGKRLTAVLVSAWEAADMNQHASYFRYGSNSREWGVDHGTTAPHTQKLAALRRGLTSTEFDWQI